MNTLIATSKIIINVPATKVWEALTTPALIKEYLFGTEAKSDWKVGSPITYSGVWEGNQYEDKGVILKIEPPKLLETSYWSVASGLADSPENYKKVSYALSEQDGNTEVTITQDNNATEEERDHSQKNWETVLQGLKKLLEK